MYCQACGAKNHAEEEYCRRCHQKLLVLSGGAVVEEQLGEVEEDFSFDEHLLERISILEEALKRTTETVQQLLEVVRKQQESLALTEAGVATARELLERQETFSEGAWESTWQRHRAHRLLAIEKHDHFEQYRPRIRALYKGSDLHVFDGLLDRAEESFASLDLEGGVASLESAFRSDPTNHELAHFLGETLFNSGRPDEALGYFDKLLSLRPDHYEGLVYAGVIQHEEGNIEQADRHLSRAEELYPDAFLPHFSLGAVWSARGEPREAARHLERAVAIDGVPQAHFLLGRSYHELGEIGRAIEQLETALERNSEFEEAYYQLGMVYLDRGWHRKALEAFRRAQELNPQKFHYRELVRYLGDAGDAPLADVPEDARSHLDRGEDALARDEADVAYRHFRQALRAAPEHPTLLTYYALACLAVDRTQEIEDTVHRVAAGDPDELLLTTAYAIWIEALRSRGRLREGQRVGRRLLEAVEGNVSRTIAYYEMAWNLAELEEDLDEALDLARKALDLSPDELRQFPLAALGWVHYKRHEFSEAVDFLSRASRLGTSSSTLTQLGMALLASGEEEEARSVLDRARTLRVHGGGVEFKMMECLRDSRRVYDRLTEQATRRP